MVAIDMYKVILFQAFAAVVAVLIGAVFWGSNGAISAAFGGLACLIPNALFVTYLTLRSVRGQPSAVVFLIGELAKLFVVTVLLALFLIRVPAVEGLPLMLGVIVTLQANLLAFLLRY